MTLQATRDLLGDERVWCIAARVEAHEGEEDHFEVNAEGQITLSVVTLRHGVPINVILGGGDVNKKGVWFIPAVGTEVIVGFDDGEFEGDGYVVGIHGRSPGGIDATKVLIIGPAVEVRAENGTAQVLAYKSDVEAVDAKYANHKHNASGGPTTGPLAVPYPPNPQYPAIDPTNPYLLGGVPTTIPGTNLANATILGTSVLKGQ